MASERYLDESEFREVPRRGCGYRKRSGIYLVSGNLDQPCGLLPRLLATCPTCGLGVRQKIGWQWVEARLVSRPGDEHGCSQCKVPGAQAGFRACMMREMASTPDLKVGLIWVGAGYYKTPEEFMAEARIMGISRRVHAVPKGLVVGETRVLLAHPRGAPCPQCNGRGKHGGLEIGDLDEPVACDACKGSGKAGAVVAMFVPRAVEQIVSETQAADGEFVEGLSKRGITPVVVRDDDPDHMKRSELPEAAGDPGAGHGE